MARGHVLYLMCLKRNRYRESALWTHPSVSITPHVSGYVFVEDVASMFQDNFNRYLRGEPVLYKVDWTSSY